MNKTELRARMIINEDTGVKLSEALNISETTFSAKLNEKSEFTRSEIAKIKKRYNLTADEIDKIFFDV